MHAMPDGGDITISTSNKILKSTEAAMLHISAGEYVQLSLTDSGCGIDEEALNQIFDPFFTTKGELGTGLGLTQVYGFVKRVKGAITINSILNQGTNILIYLPHHISAIVQEQVVPTESTNLTGTENILIVDDEVAICELSKNLLQSKGYHVLVANSGEIALKLLENTDIDLVVSDVIMPGMDGYKLAATIRQKYPDIKIQLMSGFEDDRKRTPEDEILSQNLLHKPYKSAQLFETVRNLLDS